MMNTGLYSSNTPEWETPQDLYDSLNNKYHFSLDPCASDQNAKCFKYYTKDNDGLSMSWENETVFMNPPYGKEIGKWVQKAHYEALLGATVVCLLPSRTDTMWWHDYCLHGDITFIRGRLKFGKGKNSAPFPSVIVVFKKHQCWSKSLVYPWEENKGEECNV